MRGSIFSARTEFLCISVPTITQLGYVFALIVHAKGKLTELCFRSHVRLERVEVSKAEEHHHVILGLAHKARGPHEALFLLNVSQSSENVITIRTTRNAGQVCVILQGETRTEEGIRGKKGVEDGGSKEKWLATTKRTLRMACIL